MRNKLLVSLIAVTGIGLISSSISANTQQTGYCVNNDSSNPNIVVGQGKNQPYGQWVAAGGSVCSKKKNAIVNITVETSGTGGNCYYYQGISINKNMSETQIVIAPYMFTPALTLNYWQDQNFVSEPLTPTQIGINAGACNNARP